MTSRHSVPGGGEGSQGEMGVACRGGGMPLSELCGVCEHECRPATAGALFCSGSSHMEPIYRGMLTVNSLVFSFLGNLPSPIRASSASIYGGNVLIYVQENTKLRHQVTILNKME